MPSYRKVIITPEAAADLRAIGHYTEATWGSKQRDRYIDLLVSEMRELAKFPDLGKPCPEYFLDGRKIRASQHVVYYRADDSAIHIVRILRHKMSHEQQFD